MLLKPAISYKPRISQRQSTVASLKLSKFPIEDKWCIAELQKTCSNLNLINFCSPRCFTSLQVLVSMLNDWVKRRNARKYFSRSTFEINDDE